MESISKSSQSQLRSTAASLVASCTNSSKKITHPTPLVNSYNSITQGKVVWNQCYVFLCSHKLQIPTGNTIPHGIWRGWPGRSQKFLFEELSCGTNIFIKIIPNTHICIHAFFYYNIYTYIYIHTFYLISYIYTHNQKKKKKF